MVASTVKAFAIEYEGWWYSPESDGTGLFVDQQGETVIVTWCHYDESENPTFLTFHGSLFKGNGGDGKEEWWVKGDLWRSYGPPPGSDYDPAVVDRIAVGTARIRFRQSLPNSADDAVLSFVFEGKEGALSLERYGYAPISAAGEWDAIQTGVYSNCTNIALNGPFVATAALSITQWETIDGWPYSRILVIEKDARGNTCIYRSNFARQYGSYIEATEAFSCENGWTGAASLQSLRVADDFLTFFGTRQMHTVETCLVRRNVAATRLGW